MATSLGCRRAISNRVRNKAEVATVRMSVPWTSDQDGSSSSIFSAIL